MTVAEDLLDALASRRPDAVALATFASLAVRIEPELLRALRVALMPGTHAAAEGDLWHSRLVRSRGPTGIVLDHDVADVLRDRLARDAASNELRPAAARARLIVKRLHRDLSPALALEEQVIWLCVRGSDSVDIDHALSRALAALDSGEREGLAAWAAAASKRLPEQARATRAGALLQGIEAARRGRRVALRGSTRDTLVDLAALLADAPRVHLGVRRRGTVVELGEIEREGAVAIEVPDTEPRVVDVLWVDPGGEERVANVAVAWGAVEVVEVGRGAVRLKSVLDEQYELPALIEEAGPDPPEHGPGPAAGVRYAILGPIELRDDGSPVAIGGPRQLALLAMLLLNANTPVSSDRLMDALWGDNPPGATKRLHLAVARLRKVLDRDATSLRTSAGAYTLEVAQGELDAEVFERALADGRRALALGDAERASDIVTRALELWRGPPLADVGYLEFAQPEIRRLEELRLGAIESRVDADLELGRHAALIGTLEALYDAQPTRERIAAQLMIALYRCGRQAEALDVYRRTNAYLAEELGLEPSPALHGLNAEMLMQSPALDAPAAGGAPANPRTPVPPLVARLGAKRLVGREDVLARLARIWADVIATGAHRVALLAGEPGVGKSSVAARFACDAAEQGATVLYGRAVPEALVPCQPFAEALRHLVAHAELALLETTSADLVELSRLVPELQRRLPDLATPLEQTVGDERRKLFAAVGDLLGDAARRAPVVVVLEALQWADASALRLLSHLARYADPAPVLILGTYRDTDLPQAPQLADMLVDLNREHLGERIQLPGLDERAVGELVADMATMAPPDLTPVLLQETRGNPFFVVEMLRQLAEYGAFDPAEAQPRGAATTIARFGVPDGVRALVERRLAHLGARTAEALVGASVLGRRFELPTLAAVTGRTPDELADALDEAITAGLLIEASEPLGAFEFSHALVRETLYRRLSTARRKLMHRRAAAALLELYGPGDDAHAAELARHFLAAGTRGDTERGVHYSVIAGRQALARLAWEDAAALFGQALERAGGEGDASDPGRQRRRVDLLLALGEARWCAGDLDGARGAYLRASDAAGALGDAESLGRAALGYAGPLRFEPGALREQTLVELLTSAIDALGDDASDPLRARVMARLAAALPSGDDERRKGELARGAISLARAAGDRAALADVLSSVLFATRSPDNLPWRIETGRELQQLAGELGDAALQAIAHGALLEDTLEAGDIDASDREREAFERLADARGERYPGWLVMLANARAALVQGRVDDSESLARTASTLGLGADDESASHALGMQLLAVRGEQSRLDDLLPDVEAFAAQYPEVPAWRCGLAFVYAQLRRDADASRELDALATNRLAALTRDAWWLFGTSMLAEAAAIVDRAPHVPALYELLEPYASHCIVTTTTCRGSAARVLGLLATRLRRFEDAERHFEHALAANAGIRSPLWVAHTQSDFAWMHRRRAEPGDDARARALLSEALAIADELGLPAVARKVELLLPRD